MYKDIAKQFKKFLDFIIYSHIWISLCGVMLSYHSFYYFDSIDNHFLFMPFMLLAFCSTLALYNVHWAWGQYILPHQEKPLWCVKYKMPLRIIAILFFFCTAFIILRYFLPLWQWFIIPFLLSFWYILKKLKIWRIAFFPKTFIVAFTWSYLFVFIPTIICIGPRVSLDILLKKQYLFFILHHFFYLYCITFFFDLRDKDEDKKSNIFHLITVFPAHKIWIIFYFALGLYFVTGILYSLVYAMNLFEFYLICIAGGILFILRFFHLPKKHDYWFYLVLDGMMAFSGLAVFFIKN